MPEVPLRILVVEDDPLFVRTLQLQLGGTPRSHRAGFVLSFCPHAELAVQILGRASFDLLLLDLHLGDREHGLEALPGLRAAAPELPVVVHSAASDHASIVAAMRLGAFDYLPKHAGICTLAEQLRALVARARGQRGADAPRPVPAAPLATPAGEGCLTGGAADGMVGNSSAMEALRRQVAVAARSNGNVMITGESGVGKELVARALQRVGEPFVAVDAATIDASLASSLLFGHERGAFTGAEQPRDGLFERAHGGALYLDEVANLSLDVQAKLLRVLQEREIWRIGAKAPRALQFRLICATNACLATRCQQGSFRSDLLMRMQVFALRVPPLRERRSDVVALFRHFLAKLAPSGPTAWTPALEAALAAYPFPGNVRELEHAAEVALAHLGTDAVLDVVHLPSAIAAGASAPPRAASDAPAVWGGETDAAAALPAMPTESGDFYAQVRGFERRTLLRAFAQHHGNISAMARTLGMDRSSLYAKLRLYAIHVPHLR